MASKLVELRSERDLTREALAQLCCASERQIEALERGDIPNIHLALAASGQLMLSYDEVFPELVSPEQLTDRMQVVLTTGQTLQFDLTEAQRWVVLDDATWAGKFVVFDAGYRRYALNRSAVAVWTLVGLRGSVPVSSTVAKDGDTVDLVTMGGVKLTYNVLSDDLPGTDDERNLEAVFEALSSQEEIEPPQFYAEDEDSFLGQMLVSFNPANIALLSAPAYKMRGVLVEANRFS